MESENTRMNWSQWAASTFTAAALIAIMGCRSAAAPVEDLRDAVATDPSLPPADAQDDGPPASFGDSACGTCAAAQCKAAFSACNDDPTCAPYRTCLDGCPVGPHGNLDSTCAVACPRGTSSIASELEAEVDACLTTGAGASCVSCGGEQDGGADRDASVDASEAPDASILHETCQPATDPDACTACKSNACCETRSRCLSNAQCRAFDDCLTACISGIPYDGGAPSGPEPTDGDFNACDGFCNARHGGALDLWAPFFACATVLCSDACGGAPTCAACTYRNCGEAYASVYGTADGYLFDDCTSSCDGLVTCFSACRSRYPSIGAGLDALLACVLSHCPSC